jgi:hypothetical protein
MLPRRKRQDAASTWFPPRPEDAPVCGPIVRARFPLSPRAMYPRLFDRTPFCPGEFPNVDSRKLSRHQPERHRAAVSPACHCYRRRITFATSSGACWSGSTRTSRGQRNHHTNESRPRGAGFPTRHPNCAAEVDRRGSPDPAGGATAGLPGRLLYLMRFRRPSVRRLWLGPPLFAAVPETGHNSWSRFSNLLRVSPRVPQTGARPRPRQGPSH